MEITFVTSDLFAALPSKPEIVYGFAASPFGECFVATAGGALCGLYFPDGMNEEIISEVSKNWSGCKLTRDDSAAARLASSIFSGKGNLKIPLLLKGSEFECRVWHALCGVGFGKLSTYTDIASEAGSPRAVRAVGSTVGRNPVSFVVPCHRILRKDGGIGGYRWGIARKKAILEWESANCP